MTFLTLILAALCVYLIIKMRRNASTLKQRSNLQRKFGSAAKYYHVRLRWEGQPVDFLFTDSQLEGAADRAAANPEDIR